MRCKAQAYPIDKPLEIMSYILDWVVTWDRRTIKVLIPHFEFSDLN